MKKKIAVIMLACMLAVSATACGESEGASNGERGVNEEPNRYMKIFQILKVLQNRLRR